MEILRLSAVERKWKMGKYGDWTRGEEEALLNILGGVNVARAILRRDVKVMVREPKYIKLHKKVPVKGARRFQAQEALGLANIGHVNDLFEEKFMDMIEDDVPDIQLGVYRMIQLAGTQDIVKEMADMGERTEIRLVHLFRLIENQAHGQEGVLSVNTCQDTAYIRGVDDKIYTVEVFFHEGQWHINAYPFEQVRPCDGGFQYFCQSS